MRKQMKIAAVVSATALLAIGASFASMAASKTGTWAQEGDNWYCYDKEGDAYEAEFCTFEGKDYYVGDDGIMLTDSWVDYNGDMFYVGETGAKTTSAWLDLVPHNDEDAEEERYWFKANGKMAKNEKLVIAGKTYYFGNEGQMLTGWVDPVHFETATAMDVDNTVYCDEDGARLAKVWVETTVPGAEDDDTDEFWYYIGSKGKVTTDKAKSINGESYIFGADGKMLSGWVAASGADFVEIHDDEVAMTAISAGMEVYFCGDSSDGHVKKNQWIKEWNNVDYGKEDADKDQYWFWIQKDGKVYIPAATEIATTSNAVKFDDAEIGLENDLTKKTAIAVKNIGDKYYAFNAKGEMQSGLIRINNDVYYFGGAEDGARKTGSVTIKDGYGVEGKFLFDTTSNNKGVGITGPKSSKLYNDGLLITSGDAKYYVATVDGNQYIVNKSGSIQTSQKKYKDGDDLICNAEGADFSGGKEGEAPKGAVTGLTY